MFDLDGNAQAIADAHHGLDDMPLAVVSDGQPQLVDGGWQRRFNDGDVRPDLVEQLVLGNDLARAQQKLMEQFERLGFYRYAAAIDEQRPTIFVEYAGREGPTPSSTAVRAT